uniref:Uncharacterized protein n=1 Tax=viral metagenome TaxID=1070528 RepID=A0A6M3J3F5_9ZZZZ
MSQRDEFKTWLEDPVTQHVFSLLAARAEYFSDLILDGMPHQEGEKLLITMGEAIGRINAYNEIIDIHFEDFQEVEDDAK